MAEKYFLTPDRNCYSILSGIPYGASDQEMPVVSAYASGLMEAAGDGIYVLLSTIHRQCELNAIAHPIVNPSIGV